MKRFRTALAAILVAMLLCGVVLAATITQDWNTQAQIEGTGDGYTTLSGTTEEFTSVVTMDTSGYMSAIVYVEVNFDATPTDDVDFRIYRSRTSDSATRDTTPLFVVRLDSGTDPTRRSFVVPLANNWWGSCQQTGSTDSHDVRIYWEGTDGDST